MSKKRLLVAAASVIVIVGSFFVVLHSMAKLPPEVVMPSSKPASARPESKMALKVNAQPAQQTLAVSSDSDSAPSVTTASTTKTSVAKCNQPAATQAAKSVSTPSSVLSSVVSGTQQSAKQIVLGTASRLGSNLEDVTGGLSE